MSKKRRLSICCLHLVLRLSASLSLSSPTRVFLSISFSLFPHIVILSISFSSPLLRNLSPFFLHCYNFPKFFSSFLHCTPSLSLSYKNLKLPERWRDNLGQEDEEESYKDEMTSYWNSAKVNLFGTRRRDDDLLELGKSTCLGQEDEMKDLLELGQSQLV